MRSHPLALVVAALLLASCGGDGDEPAPAAGTTTAVAASPSAELPSAEDVSTLPPPIRAGSFPDHAVAIGDTMWVSGVDPGIVGFDAATGEQRAAVPVQSGRLPVHMVHGFGALWAAERMAAGDAVTLLRIDPATATVIARVSLPTPGALTNSSLAVTEDAVWALVGTFGQPYTALVAVDPGDGTAGEPLAAPLNAKTVQGGFGSLWVSTGDNTVVRVDPADGSTTATIPTGRGPGYMTVTEDALWVVETLDGTLARIDPQTDEVVARVRVSEASISYGAVAAGGGSVWVRTNRELATEVDARTDEVVRVLGPGRATGGIAVADAAVWITAREPKELYRVPTT